MKFLLLLAILPLIANFCASASNSTTEDHHDHGISELNAWENIFGKRSEKFIPSHYEIELRPIMEDGHETPRHSMPGKVRIIGTTMEKTQTIRLDPGNGENRLNVNPRSIKVTSNDASIPIQNLDGDGLLGLQIELDKKVGGGETIEIYIEYVAKIQQKEFSNGLIHLPCDMEKDTNCSQTQIAINGFNAYSWTLGTNCGTVFPCVDNRDLKSTFNLSLVRPNEYGSAANGELVSTTPDSQFKGWVVDKYSWTVKTRMPLLAFTVFKDYSYVESLFGKEKKSVRVCAPKEEIKGRNEVYTFTAKSAAKILSFYEEYFGSSANVIKMELFFVPTVYIDFGTWFMQSKGLNFFNLLHLIPKNEADNSTQIRVLQSIVGSLAQQWLGNWWDPEPETTLIFTKALPRYLEYLGLQEVDASLSDAAIYKDMLEAEEVDRDDENYQSHKSHWSKGTLLLRMMEGIMTKDVMKAGLRTYFNRLWNDNGYNVTTPEFYHILQNVIGNSKLPYDVATILNSFVENIGIPLVRVGVVNETHFVFKQERLRYQDSRNKTNSGVWYLPVTYTQESGSTRHTVWLTPDQNVTYVAGNTTELLLVNPDATGYYRTLYEDSSLLKRLQQRLELNHTEFNPLTRAGLLSDGFILADEKYTSYGAVLNLTSYFSQGNNNETSLVVWTAFLSKFTGTYNKFISHVEYPKLKKFVMQNLNKVLDYTNPPREKEEIALQDYLLDTACKLNHPVCQTKANDVFSQWRLKPNESSPLDYLYPESRSSIQCAIVSNGGQDAFDFLMLKYRQAIQADKSTESTRAILQSLACASDKVVFKKFVELLLTPTESGRIKEYNRWHTEDYVYSTPLPNRREILLPFISKNFDIIDQKLGHHPGESVIPAKISSLTRSWHFTTAEKKKEIQELFKLHEKTLQDEGNVIIVPRVYRELDSNIQWMDTQGQDILNSIMSA